MGAALVDEKGNLRPGTLMTPPTPIMTPTIIVPPITPQAPSLFQSVFGSIFQKRFLFRSTAYPLAQTAPVPAPAYGFCLKIQNFEKVCLGGLIAAGQGTTLQSSALVYPQGAVYGAPQNANQIVMSSEDKEGAVGMYSTQMAYMYPQSMMIPSNVISVVLFAFWFFSRSHCS